MDIDEAEINPQEGKELKDQQKRAAKFSRRTNNMMEKQVDVSTSSQIDELGNLGLGGDYDFGSFQHVNPAEDIDEDDIF